MTPGVDIVSVARIERALSRFKGVFVARILAPEERELYQKRRDKAQFLAGRFAAKEAIYKAAGIRELTWQRVTVLPEGKRPIVWIDGEKREDIQVSISHEKEYAIAMALFNPEPNNG